MENVAVVQAVIEPAICYRLSSARLEFDCQGYVSEQLPETEDSLA
jgi:hypothetical protein